MSKLEMFKQWWRPIGVSIFILSISLRYLGIIEPQFSEAVELRILEIMKWFIGLYTAGRSFEKISTHLKPIDKQDSDTK